MSELKRLRICKAVLISLAVGAFLAAVSAVLFYFNVGIPCVFNVVTGLKCPGCGNTRAVLRLMHFDFLGSLKMNLMFLPQAAYLVMAYIYAFKNYINGGKFRYNPPHIAIDIAFLALLIIWFIIRNIFKI